MNIADIYLLLQTQAVHDILNKTDLYFQRKVLRWYSKTFNTPLHIAYTLPWDEILQHYYEHNFEQLNKNDLIKTMSELVPQLDKQEQDSFDDWVKEVEEQAERETKQQSLNKPSKGSDSKSKETPTNTPDVHRTFDLQEDEDL